MTKHHTSSMTKEKQLLRKCITDKSAFFHPNHIVNTLSERGFEKDYKRSHQKLQYKCLNYTLANNKSTKRIVWVILSDIASNVSAEEKQWVKKTICWSCSLAEIKE